MTVLTASQRGDMVEALLPEAAGLVVDVHEGSADDIKTRLRGLTRHELEAVTVVLAALADPDRSLKDALSWVDFDEHGQQATPPLVLVRSVRDAAPVVKPKGRGIDAAAVQRALSPGPAVDLNRDERRLAIEVGIRRGMTYDDVAQRLGMDRESVKRAWERAKDRARAEGRRLPLVAVGGIREAS
ncbi:hypothetical protein OG402_40825 [Streptomyces anulatus]|uniref:hypothetical protein n=1 Tax=Streptomyces anulatus TaxID=1892 RepID=UPI00224E8E6A|nr:hypothetical protein [Streptomyces anulatus]MCX4606772.1 hypothetical protein [Streptomyces anulatus]